MRTEKLDRLISALGNPVHQVQQTHNENTEVSNNPSANSLNLANDDAVQIDSTLARSNEAELSARQAKIERLSSQIESGAYRPSSEAISVAFIKELGI